MVKVFCDSSTKEGCFVIEHKAPVIVPYGEAVTNNVGEYKIVVLTLEMAKSQELEHVEVFTDSLLVVNQVNGLWKCRKEHLLPLRDRVRALAQATQATITWISREENPAGKFLG